MPYFVICVCRQEMVVPDDRSGDLLRCTRCGREMEIPEVVTPPPPPPRPPAVPEPADDRPVIVVDGAVEERGHVPHAPGRRAARYVAVGLALLAGVGTLPVMLAWWPSSGSTAVHVERWAWGILIAGCLQLVYAIYLWQLPDWSSMRVVSLATLGIATLYALLAGMRLLASPGNRAIAYLELDGNRFSSHQESLWCFLLVLLTGTLSYVAGRLASQWSHRGEL